MDTIIIAVLTAVAVPVLELDPSKAFVIPAENITFDYQGEKGALKQGVVMSSPYAIGLQQNMEASGSLLQNCGDENARILSGIEAEKAEVFRSKQDAKRSKSIAIAAISAASALILYTIFRVRGLIKTIRILRNG